MNDELHAAGFVEEPFEDERALRRQSLQGSPARGEIVEELRCGDLVEAQRLHEPTRVNPPMDKGPFRDLTRKARSSPRKLIRAAGRLPRPEWNGRRLSMSV